MEDYLPCLFVIFAAIEIIILPYNCLLYTSDAADE